MDVDLSDAGTGVVDARVEGNAGTDGDVDLVADIFCACNFVAVVNAGGIWVVRLEDDEAGFAEIGS